MVLGLKRIDKYYINYACASIQKSISKDKTIMLVVIRLFPIMTSRDEGKYRYFLENYFGLSVLLPHGVIIICGQSLIIHLT